MRSLLLLATKTSWRTLGRAWAWRSPFNRFEVLDTAGRHFMNGRDYSGVELYGMMRAAREFVRSIS